MKRRSFIKNMAGAGALVGLGSTGLLSFSEPGRHITILHTNDVHSHIEAFPAGHPHFAGLGGVAKRYSLIEEIRRENPNTLLLDAGDIFQGTPYFNFYKGALELELMSKLGYDAATIGNHDFDNGVEGLFKQLPHADFDFVSANYDFNNTLLENRVNAFKLIEKNGVRIGIFGLGIKLEGLVNKKRYLETKYLDPLEMTRETVRILKEEKECDLVICLSHLGYRYEDDSISDLKLAQHTSGIDLIIGGHTHTFLPEPTRVLNAEGKTVLVNQVGWAGVYLGRVDFYVRKEENYSTGLALQIQ